MHAPLSVQCVGNVIPARELLMFLDYKHSCIHNRMQSDVACTVTSCEAGLLYCYFFAE